jgi:hypothetical protein
MHRVEKALDKWAGISGKVLKKLSGFIGGALWGVFVAMVMPDPSFWGKQVPAVVIGLLAIGFISYSASLWVNGRSGEREPKTPQAE